MQAYFDNSATTKPCKEAIEAVNSALVSFWGNASSTHYLGNEANAMLIKAREQVAKALSCDEREIFFTSGGTESNNTAVLGAAHSMKRYGNRVVTTVAEHPSVYDAFTVLENEGFEVIRLRVGNDGKPDIRELIDSINDKTVLVSMMMVNNEVGSIFPVDKIKKILTRAGSKGLIHIDAVQAFGKIAVKPLSLGADLLTVSSHKIHGPKGVGALYIKKGVKIKPLHFGGEQQEKLRPGTEPMPLIAGFGAACEAMGDIKETLDSVKQKRDYFLEKIKVFENIVINSPADALPYIVNISVLGKKSEPMLNFLSTMGICVSAGSACSKGKKSRVLKEMGLSFERLDSPIRISFSKDTTIQEIDYLIEGITKINEGSITD